jgi:hypothetical protein
MKEPSGGSMTLPVSNSKPDDWHQVFEETQSLRAKFRYQYDLLIRDNGSLTPVWRCFVDKEEQLENKTAACLADHTDENFRSVVQVARELNEVLRELVGSNS